MRFACKSGFIGGRFKKLVPNLDLSHFVLIRQSEHEVAIKSRIADLELLLKAATENHEVELSEALLKRLKEHYPDACLDEFYEEDAEENVVEVMSISPF